MSTTSDATRHDSDTTTPADVATPVVQWLSVADAAKHFGVSLRTMQRKVSAKTLTTKNEEGRVLVDVGATRQDATEAAPVTTKRHVDATRHDTVVPADAALLAHQAQEIEYLRAELTAQREANDKAQSELRRLMVADKSELSELRQRLTIVAAAVGSESADSAITTPDGGTSGSANTNAQKPRRWWHWFAEKRG